MRNTLISKRRYSKTKILSLCLLVWMLAFVVVLPLVQSLEGPSLVTIEVEQTKPFEKEEFKKLFDMESIFVANSYWRTDGALKNYPISPILFYPEGVYLQTPPPPERV